MANVLHMEGDSGFVVVNVSNSKNDSVAFEVKFAKNLKISQLKSKLEILTGGSAGTMQLELYKGDKLVAKMNDDEALLGSLPIDSGMRIHVIDNFTWLTEETVEKFELTAEQYDSKGETLRHFLKMNNLGKYNEEEMRLKEEKRRQQQEEEQQKAATINVGDRCQVSVPGNPIRRGTIMYNGPIDGKKGIFIGVKYDEPLGKNNGSIDGKSYFVCEPKYGGFVPPSAIEVGDFPEQPFDLEDEI